MKHTKLPLRIAALLLCLALAAAAAPFALAAGPAPSGFRYNHDPRLNPAAMADIVWSPTAVYGFAPSPEGSLSAYVDFDWSDAAIVESGRADKVILHPQAAYTKRLISDVPKIHEPWDLSTVDLTAGN